MATSFEIVKQNLTTLKEQLKEAHQNEYFNTPQDKCYNPQPLLNAISKVENALYDLEASYGILI